MNSVRKGVRQNKANLGVDSEALRPPTLPVGPAVQTKPIPPRTATGKCRGGATVEAESAKQSQLGGKGKESGGTPNPRLGRGQALRRADHAKQSQFPASGQHGSFRNWRVSAAPQRCGDRKTLGSAQLKRVRFESLGTPVRRRSTRAGLGFREGIWVWVGISWSRCL